MKRIAISVFVSLVFIFTAAQELFANMPPILRVEDLVPGTKAVGFSDFQGVKHERFEVLLGEPHNSAGRLIIFGRISGGPMETPLEVTGPIAGMSGSPIFLADTCSTYDECVNHGTLVGALSYGFTIIPQGGMNTGFTSAEDMLGSKSAGYDAVLSIAKKAEPETMTRPLLVSLPAGAPEISGFRNIPAAAARVKSSSFESYCAKNAVKAELGPGSMISIPLAMGDVTYAAAGTVTWRDGDRIWAFGHPFFGRGKVNYPFRHVSVATTIQSTVDSYKVVGCDIGDEGAITVDGATEISGVIGADAPLVPILFTLQVGGKTFTLDEKISETPYKNFLIQYLPQWWAEDIVGVPEGASVRYYARVTLKGESEIFLENVVVTRDGALALNDFFSKVSGVTSIVENSGFPFEFESIRLGAELVGPLEFWEKESIFLSKKEAKPGETVTLSIILRKFPEANEFRRIDVPVTVPADFFAADQTRMPYINILVRDGGQYMKIFFRPVMPEYLKVLLPPGSAYFTGGILGESRTLKELIANINKLNLSADTIYVREEFPQEISSQDNGRAEGDNSAEPDVAGEAVWRNVSDPSLGLDAAANDEPETRQRSLPPVAGAVTINEQLSVRVVQPAPSTEPTAEKSKEKKPFWRKILPFV